MNEIKTKSKLSNFRVDIWNIIMQKKNITSYINVYFEQKVHTNKKIIMILQWYIKTNMEEN